ncbi:hypothetical protein B1F79_03570 [Coxiella-like endosymbiont of Rhipicephalus sanguineus]|nr:hypothetical protein [Coxiella-like endosymbiont of Rhipicephalus sanguineus]
MLYLLIKRKRNFSILILEKKLDALLYGEITTLHYLSALISNTFKKMIFFTGNDGLRILRIKKFIYFLRITCKNKKISNKFRIK